MNLKAEGYRARYLPEYLATGEAPEDGAVFRQRSRWCKGHLQALFSRQDCPLFRRGLSLTQRALYSSGAWAYAAAALTTPALASVPIAALAFDALPFAITPRLACAFVPYFLAVHAVVYWCDAPDLLRALWFGGVATRLLWWTYFKALVNTALWSLGLKRKMAFKTTAKAGIENGTVGGGVNGGKRGGMPSKAASSVSTISSLSRSQRSISDEDAGPSTSSSPSKQKAMEKSSSGSMIDQAPTVASVRDLWAPMALMAASLAAAAVGLRRVARGEDSAALDVSIAWACYNALPPLLLAHYAWLGRGASLRGACGMAMAACAAVLAGAAAVSSRKRERVFLKFFLRPGSGGASCREKRKNEFQLLTHSISSLQKTNNNNRPATSSSRRTSAASPLAWAAATTPEARRCSRPARGPERPTTATPFSASRRPRPRRTRRRR